MNAYFCTIAKYHMRDFLIFSKLFHEPFSAVTIMQYEKWKKKSYLMKLTKITEANTSAWMFSYKFAAFFQEGLHLWRAASVYGEHENSCQR